MKLTLKKQHRPLGKRAPFPLVIIGSSTGGPQIVEQILSELPDQYSGAAIVIVQHMPEFTTKTMTKRLDRTYPITIREAEDGMLLNAGSIVVVPGDKNLTFTHSAGRITVSLTSCSQNAKHCCPCIDATMESAAEVFGERALGVILSGMGQDGARGMQAIRAAGGETIAQDPQTCVVDSMVQYAIGSDGVGLIVTPGRIAKFIQMIATQKI